MARGYWIPHIDVNDPEGYKAYMAATPAAHEKYGGRALVRAGAQEIVEGMGRSRNVLREFPDYATALACYRSPEYQRARPLRLAHSVCDFVIARAMTACNRIPLPCHRQLRHAKAIGSGMSMSPIPTATRRI
jgi:uncharacterized protein (DUF1330 family)